MPEDKKPAMPEKRVRVTLEMSNEFLKMLKATCQMSRYFLWDPSRSDVKEDELPPKLTAVAAVGLMACMEGCGGLPEQVDASLPHEWRADLEVIHDERRVYLEGEQITGPILIEWEKAENIHKKKG